jgi:hypothetical protein
MCYNKLVVLTGVDYGRLSLRQTAYCCTYSVQLYSIYNTQHQRVAQYCICLLVKAEKCRNTNHQIKSNVQQVGVYFYVWKCCGLYMAVK